MLYSQANYISLFQDAYNTYVHLHTFSFVPIGAQLLVFYDDR